MALFDKLSQRGLQRMGKDPNKQSSILGVPAQKPLPTIGETLQKPPATMPTTMAGKVGQLPQAGAVGSMPQFQNIKKRFIADLPAKTQLEGIAQILSGQDTNSPILNNFVKGMAAKGAQPEDIRQAFIQHQKASPDPLVLL